MANKVLITGASGLLGRALVKAFLEIKWDVTGLAHSRGKEGDKLRLKCDLTNEQQTRTIIQEVKPDVIIHCMAERRPDKVEGDPDKASLLNIKVTDTLSRIANEASAWFLYISTDYVFDGKNPPYATNAETNPVNEYGKTKREGEVAVWKNQHDAGILRVSILYGDVETLDESAITVLASPLLNNSPAQLDNYNIRWPTLVDDVAAVCVGLCERKMEHCGLYGTWHFAGNEKYTKYEMAQEIAKALGIPFPDNITPVSVANSKSPHNAQLNCIALEVMGLKKVTPFATAIKRILQPFVNKT